MPRVLDEALPLPLLLQSLSLPLPQSLPLLLSLPLPLRFAKSLRHAQRILANFREPSACVSLSLLLCYLNCPPANARGRCSATQRQPRRLIFNLICSLISHLICKPDTVRMRSSCQTIDVGSVDNLHKYLPNHRMPLPRMVPTAACAEWASCFSSGSWQKKPKKAKKKCWPDTIKKTRYKDRRGAKNVLRVPTNRDQTATPTMTTTATAAKTTPDSSLVRTLRAYATLKRRQKVLSI